MNDPDIRTQAEFWDSWNSEHLPEGHLDDLTRRQADIATAVANTLKRPRILEVGCGTGWLCEQLQQFGSVTGTDLSPASIYRAARRMPAGTFVAGDFLSLDLKGPFDVILSADVLAHVADQRAFIQRIAGLLRPGGKFVLMTQNGFVWRRPSHLAPQQPGQLRNWPSLKCLRQLLATSFTIDRVGSIVPGGDRGVLRIARLMRGGCSALGMGARAVTLLEVARVGRELTVVATRR
jgi:2-polyprenyl-3-methyl-5-hydroxy-6-metoxy-1,4-benzoquinol methylase